MLVKLFHRPLNFRLTVDNLFDSVMVIQWVAVDMEEKVEKDS